jgi:hypothetical protein
VILSVLVCDILINILLQTSALVGPLNVFQLAMFHLYQSMTVIVNYTMQDCQNTRAITDSVSGCVVLVAVVTVQT